MSKKKNKKKTDEPQDLQVLVKQLRKENEQLRARLEKIAELSGDLQVSKEDGLADQPLITGTEAPL